MNLCAGADLWSTLCSSCVWSCHNFLLGGVFVEPWCGLKSPLGVLVLRILGINFCQMLSMTTPYLPLEDRKLFMTGICLCWGHASYQSSCLPIPTMKQVMKRPKAPWHLTPPFGHLLDSFTKRYSNILQFVWVWFSMSQQIGASGVNQVDTDSNSVLLKGQKLISKSLRVHQGQPTSTWVLYNCVVGNVLRESWWGQ